MIPIKPVTVRGGTTRRHIKRDLPAIGALAFLAAASTAVYAQNLKKLQDFRVTGAPLDLEVVAQDEQRAMALSNNLERIKLPPGFKIGLTR
jgi:hypothetical protein